MTTPVVIVVVAALNLFQCYLQFYPVMQYVLVCGVSFLIQGLQILD